MMVSMGIYDTLIHCITHLFKEFKKSVMTLLPYAIGMAVAIGALSFALKWAFANYALPTNTLFIGLILGGLPAILRQVKGKKKGPVGAVLFLAFFALIILMQLFQSENSVTIQLSVVEVLKLFVLGAVASATMIIPGVSGSMILKILGYYEPVVTVGIPGLLTGLRYGDWAAVAANLGILVPFGLGVIVGIFAIAKLIEVLLARLGGADLLRYPGAGGGVPGGHPHGHKYEQPGLGHPAGQPGDLCPGLLCGLAHERDGRTGTQGVKFPCLAKSTLADGGLLFAAPAGALFFMPGAAA